MFKYYSYDIFDTCLVRTCGRPNIVFDILAREILGEDVDFNLLADFAYERKQSEKRARQKWCNKECEEVTIDQIYQECDFSLYTNVSKDNIKKKEIEIESKILCPVKKIKEEITNYRKQGAQIIFISDMYLGKEILKEILHKHGLYENNDKIFISSDAKVTKASGNLYRHVAKEIGIAKFKEWLHTGDNFHADVKTPKKLGIRTKLISHDYTYYERKISCFDFYNQNFEAMKIASISRSILCEFGSSPRLAFASDFIAPIYVPFVEHILANANKKGFRKLYFLARDGYILYKIAQILGKNYPNISLHYLYVSRDSLYLPGLPNNYSIDDIKHFFWNIDSFKPENIIHRLHMSDYNYSSISLNGKYGFEVLEALFDDKDFSIEFNRRRQEQKELCYRYLKQEGLTEGKSAIVDLASTKRSLAAINRILGKEDEIYGYYFIVNYQRNAGTNYYSMNYQERAEENLINCNMNPQMLLESYFSITDQNRTSSYKSTDGTITPVFEDDATDCYFRKKIYEINESVCLDFAKKYMLIANRKMNLQQSGYGMAAYSRFLLAPDLYYIKALEKVRLSESKNLSMAVLKKKPKMFEYEDSLWRMNKVYNSLFPQLITFFFRMKMKLNPCVDGIKNANHRFDSIVRIGESLKRFYIAAKSKREKST